MEVKMITRRDLIVACFASCCTLGVIAIAAETSPVMSSAVFDWNSIPAEPNKTGSTRTFFKGRTATLDNLEVHVTTLNPGQAPHTPHQHPNEELVIVKEGTIEALVNGEWKKIGPGSVFFIASNQMHGVRNPGPGNATYHVVGWKSSATPAPSAQ
jgi:quercetin dioxygenase-like cupin family protein